jgi:hypothetical protein
MYFFFPSVERIEYPQMHGGHKEPRSLTVQPGALRASVVQESPA